MDVLLLHNENAGDATHSRASLENILRDAGFTPIYRDLHRTIGTSDLLKIGEFVVVAGGDGSIRKVALALLGHDRALAPLPLGTANNISHALALDAPLDQIVRGWSHALRRRIDVGYVTGPWGRRPFVESVGLGLIPRLIAISDYLHPGGSRSARASREHKLARDRAVLAALAHEVSAHAVELHLDDHDASGRFVLLEMLNINRLGPGIDLAPAATPFDGAFDVLAVSADRRDDLRHALKTAIDDGIVTTPLATTRCRRIELVTRAPELRLDDEILPLTDVTRLTLELQPPALEFILPGSPAM